MGFGRDPSAPEARSSAALGPRREISSLDSVAALQTAIEPSRLHIVLHLLQRARPYPYRCSDHPITGSPDHPILWLPDFFPLTTWPAAPSKNRRAGEVCMMFRHFVVALLAAGAVSAAIPLVQAQSAVLDLPRDSQHAQITQKIGITNITINYHRPLVKGRKVFGGLQPYGQVWRAGANENTTIEFTDPVAVEGNPLAAGTYGLHMIPGEQEWTVIFSKAATSWGSFTYDQKEDALRVAVKPQASEFHEALTYDYRPFLL